MKFFLSAFLIMLVLSLSFSGVLFLVNSASAVENKANQSIENVKPWEAFRGWAPSVPYGQTYSSKDVSESTKKLLSIEKNSFSKKEKEAKATNLEEDSNKKEDHIKPWEAYRGWAPSVPYGK